MFREGTNHDDVQPADVLCDFCAQPWNETAPFVEGHRGRHICGDCLAAAYRAIVIDGAAGVTEFECVLCREAAKDRAALERADEPGWAPEGRDDVAICRRCLKQAAGVLHKDPDYAWSKPA